MELLGERPVRFQLAGDACYHTIKRGSTIKRGTVKLEQVPPAETYLNTAMSALGQEL